MPKNETIKNYAKQDLSTIDIYQNEMDFQYRKSGILKLLFISGINYQKIPSSLRNAAASLLFKKSSFNYREFPIDNKVDFLKAKNFKNKPFEGRFAVCFTHDVDTQYGFEKGIDLLRNIEKKHNLRSTWTIVPRSREYKIDVNILKDLQNQGNEIAVHGLYHDGKFAYISSEDRNERIKLGKEILMNMMLNINGFRAPWANRTRDMISFLEKHGYTWDSSYPDTDPSTIGYEGTGCSTVFPFFPLIYENGGYRYSKVLELPITIPQDWTLMNSLKYSDDKVLELWKGKVDYIESIGGLALFLTHPDSYDMGNPDKVWIYDEIIKYVKAKDPIIGTCREISDIWRKFETAG